MINKEDVEIRNKIHDLADRDKSNNGRDFPLDTSLDYSRENVFEVLKSERGTVEDLNSSSVAVVYDEKKLKNKKLGKSIDSYDEVIRVGAKGNNNKSYDVGGQSDFQILEKDDFIYQNIYSGADIILSDLNGDNIPDVFYDTVENNSNIYILTEDFIRFLENFRRVHELNDVPDYLVSILISLKLFDVVHFFGLDPYELSLEDLVFSFHFKGFITLKDIYE